MSGEENIGIGDDDLDEGPGAKGVFFDDQDLFGDREEKAGAKNERNRLRMLLEELCAGDVAGDGD